MTKPRHKHVAHHLAVQRLKGDELRAWIARQVRDSRTQREIAAELGISQPAVSQHLAVYRHQLLEKGLFDFKEALVRELGVLDKSEATAWEAFERSCQPAVTEREVRDPKTGELYTVREVRHQAGDPRFLEQVQRASERRAGLLGLIQKGAVGNQVNVQINEAQKQDPRLEIAQILRQQVERLRKGTELLGKKAEDLGVVEAQVVEEKPAVEVTEAGATLQAGGP